MIIDSVIIVQVRQTQQTEIIGGEICNNSVILSFCFRCTSLLELVHNYDHFDAHVVMKCIRLFHVLISSMNIVQ